MILILHPDGHHTWTPFEAPSDDCLKQLDQLQRIVGGYIELVPFSHQLVAILGAGSIPDQRILIVVNEEGLVRDLPTNPFIPILRGPIVFVSGFVEGDMTDLSPEQTTWLIERFDVAPEPSHVEST